MTTPTLPPLATSSNLTEEKKKVLMELFPEAFSEGRLDIAALKRALGEQTVIEQGERYALTWAGKREAYKVLQTPSSATLRPQRQLSVNFDEAQHIFIEGENLEVLKVLQKAYFGKVKLIYIDPPYNTGSDSFIYPDRFQESKEEYFSRLNELNDDGTLMREGYFRKNNKENGHFHSNWLSMMLPRLYIARNLLNEDGVIFVSIDDNEVHNLRLLMDEIFGEENFVAQFVWKSRQIVDSRTQNNVSNDHEYMLCYSRAFDRVVLKGRDIDKNKYTNTDNDPRGPWMSNSILGLANAQQRPNLHYTLINPANGVAYSCPSDSGWRYSQETMRQKIAENRIVFPKDLQGRPREKKFLSELTSESTGVSTILSAELGYTLHGSRELRDLFSAKVFDFPKPVDLLKWVISQGMNGENSIVMDFFLGSGSTAQAVLELNEEINLSIQFIGVQFPEPLPDDTTESTIEMSIADIARERLRRTIDKMKGDTNLFSTGSSNLGFKSFLLTPSNFKPWRGDGIETPEQLEQQMKLFIPGEKEGAKTEDMLYELLLKFGQELTTPIETLRIIDTPVFAIQQRQMFFLLETFHEAMIAPLRAIQPREIVAIDAIFQDSDELKTNLYLQCHHAGIKFTCI